MKNMKKITSMIMTVIMVFAMMTTAFADTTTPDAADVTPSITITTAVKGQTYKIYKMLDLTSYKTEVEGETVKESYSYKVNDTWKGFMNSETAAKYLTVDAEGYVTWKAGDDETLAPEFAKEALAWAKKNISATQTIKVSEATEEEPSTTTSIKFDNLELGYYLVDSSLGALCGLTTTDPTASIVEKNTKPELEKAVLEDSNSQWGDSNSADIGQTVQFRITIDAHSDAENFVVHDKMSDGLTFTGITSIKHLIVSNKDEHEVEKKYYTVVTKDLIDGCTFEIQFTDEFCSLVHSNDDIIILYEAVLNEKAVITDNPNEAMLSYGDDNETVWDKTVTKTYEIDLSKTDTQNKPLTGAEFKIYTAAEGGREVPVTKVMDENGNFLYYRVKHVDELSTENVTGDTIVVNDEDAQVTIKGFDNGKYYLEETRSPVGYNQLTTRREFIIEGASLKASYDDVGNLASGSGVHVINKTGTELPETGGMGTTVIYIAGGALVLLAVVLLITKKRMGGAE